MSQLSRSAIESELYLQGVLSAMEELPNVSDEVKKEIANENFTLKISILGGSNLYLTFKNGTISADRTGSSDVGLLFLSHQQFLNSVLEKGISIPIPSHGWQHISKLMLFQRLGEKMQEILEPKSYQLLDPIFLEKHLRLTCHVALHATQHLADISPEGKRWLTKVHTGCIEFIVANASVHYWMDVSNKGIILHHTMPTHPATAQILFKDAQVAFQALNDKIIQWEALGLGQIQVRGDILLADQFSMIMDKVANYIKPRF